MDEVITDENFVKYSEIFRLHYMLDNAGIQHDLKDESNEFDIPRVFYHLYYPSKEDWFRASYDPFTVPRMCSVVEGDGTLGSTDNKLELIGMLTEEEERHGPVVGGLTADDIFARIEEAEKKRVELFRHVQPTDEEGED